MAGGLENDKRTAWEEEFYVEKGSKFKRASRKLVNLRRIMKMKNERWGGGQVAGAGNDDENAGMNKNNRFRGKG